MKRVFEEYGSAVIAVLLASTIFAVLLGGNVLKGRNLPQLLGEVLTYSVGERDIYENSAFQDYLNAVPPKIIQREDILVRENERILLSNMFEARSQEGSLLPVYLQKAWRLNGQETDLGLSSDGTSICVPDAGVYWVELYAVDDKQRETTVMVKLLVNER